MDASRLPLVIQDKKTLDLVARHAPIIRADANEPFIIVAAGYTIFDSERPSPSFKKRELVEWYSAGYPAKRAIEYALWWDWDIGHLYELEHVWVFLNERDHVVAVEASWHGMHGQIEINGHPVLDPSGQRPILFAQPGKHAMAATEEPFGEIFETAAREVGPDAGKDGLLETDLFRGRLHKTPEADARVTALLKHFAFTPTWQFTKEIRVTRDMLVPWSSLEEWIPARIEWWLEKMKELGQ